MDCPVESDADLREESLRPDNDKYEFMNKLSLSYFTRTEILGEIIEAVYQECGFRSPGTRMVR